MKQINELYDLIMTRADHYGIELNWRVKERILTNFECSVDYVLGTSKWSYDDKISIDDFNNILAGFEEEFEAMKEVRENERN